MFIKINTKWNITIFILFLAFFLPSCAARDIYNVYEAEQELRGAKEMEAKNGVFETLRNQQSYHDDFGSFSNKTYDLGVFPVSIYYDVQIIEADKNKAIVTGIAKENDISSFAGIIEYQSDEYKIIVCRTKDPAKSIELPIDAETCGSDSEEVYKDNNYKDNTK